MQVDHVLSLRDDLIARHVEVVQNFAEVGVDLLELSVEVVRVEKVAFLVVGQLAGDVDRLADLDGLRETELALSRYVVAVGVDSCHGFSHFVVKSESCGVFFFRLMFWRLNGNGSNLLADAEKLLKSKDVHFSCSAHVIMIQF